MKLNKLIKKTNCPFCPTLSYVRKRINKKLPDNIKISSDNIIDADKFNVVRYPIIKILKYEGEGRVQTPHLTLSEIKDGKIKEMNNIKGEYPKEIIEAFLNGWFNDEMKEEHKDSYSEDLKEESKEVFIK